MRKSFAAILESHGGAGPGFDLLRLLLAVAILVSHLSAVGETRGIIPSTIDLFRGVSGHTPAVTKYEQPALETYDDKLREVPAGLSRPIVLTHVPMFFALSGFLVSGSAFRTKRVLPFLALRFFRIFPALCVEVALSAIVIGSVFTALPLRTYFTSQRFWTYFGNIIGIVQMDLPGVFFKGSGEIGVVNANLWTLPSEFDCYLVLSILLITGLVFNRAIFTLVFTIATIVLLIANLMFGYNAKPGLVSGSVNVYYFFTGVLFFLWRERVVYNVWILLPCVFITYLLMWSPHGVYAAPLMLTYVTIFIGLTDFPKSRLLESGDYSYGIYLYGYPISQVVISVFPALHGHFFGLLFPAVISTALFSAFSWHFVEKRFLRLRRRFSAQSAEIASERQPNLASRS